MNNTIIKEIIKKFEIVSLTAIMALNGCGKVDKSNKYVGPTTKYTNEFTVPTAVPTTAPTATPVPTIAPTATPVPTVAPTATPMPTIAPTATPKPTKVPTTAPTPVIANDGEYRYVKLPVNVLNQNDFPTGCESVSTVMALQYLGYDITKAEFIDNYLPRINTYNDYYKNKDNKDCVFSHYFVGDPRSNNGTACFPTVIESAVDKYFEEINESNYICNNYTGAEFDKLIDKLEEGKPVIIWLTMYLKEPTKSYMLGDTKCYNYNHTCVLAGVDEKNNIAFVAEPMSGEMKKWPLDTVIKRYNFMGSKAAVIEQKIIEMDQTEETKTK